MEVKTVAPPSSIAILPTWCLSHPLFSNGRALQVLFAYCAHADKTGITRCSQERIAALLGISRQMVSRYVQRMVAAGILRHHTWRHMGNGRMLKQLRVVFDPKSSATAADLRSIAQPPGPTQRYTVAQGNGEMRKLSTTLSDLRNPSSCVGDVATTSSTTYATPQLRGPTQPQAVAQSIELLKNTTQPLLSADEAIRQWLTYAWKHGQHTPIADEQDLATAHALVAKHVTAEQLETAVIADPEADQLAPLVRSLLA